MAIANRHRHRISFDLRGDPGHPPLLLVMGMGLGAEAWGNFAERLVPDFRLITFDNRGVGHSSDARWPYRMRTLAEDAVAVLDACGIRRAHVFGISMGGMIAQELALRHPERVDRLALGCTFASWAKSRKPRWRDLGAFLHVVTATRPDPGDLADLLVSREYFASGEGQARFARWREDAERIPPRKVLLQVVAVGLHSTAQRLRRLRAPTLILSGDADRIVPVEEARRLAELIPDARLRVLKGAGHVFPLEREDEAVAALREHFLRPAPEHDGREVSGAVASDPWAQRARG